MSNSSALIDDDGVGEAVVAESSEQTIENVEGDLSEDTVILSPPVSIVDDEPIMLPQKAISPPISCSSADDYAEPIKVMQGFFHQASPSPPQQQQQQHQHQLLVTTSNNDNNASPLYAQVNKEPRNAEFQKIHSTIPNIFKNVGHVEAMTTFLGGVGGAKILSSVNTPTTPSTSSSSTTTTTRTQVLAASYSNDLNSSYDSILGSNDMLSDSDNHSDSWMYPGGRRKASTQSATGVVRTVPPSSFTEQLNQVLADRERFVLR